jgi:hypothetical protein
MKCPYLQGNYLQSCKATREVYIPSRFEFDEYCTHRGHKMCPSYTRAIYEGNPAVTTGRGNPVLSAR